METWENIQSWIEKKRVELDDEFITTRMKEENRVVQVRSEAAKQVDEYSKKIWEKANIEVDRIRSDYQNDYQEKKRALENLIELKISEYEARRSQRNSPAMIKTESGSVSSKSQEKPKRLSKRSSVQNTSPETYVKGASSMPAISTSTVMKIKDTREDSSKRFKTTALPVLVNSNVTCANKEITSVHECPGPKRISNSEQVDLAWSCCAINHRRQVRAASSYVIVRAQLKQKPNKEESILCKIVTLSQLSPWIRSNLTNQSLSIMRYLCYNDGRRQARQPIFIKIYEILANDSKLMIYMREYSAYNLEERFQQQQFETLADWNESQLINWTKQLCDGVIYLHNICIAHLNIKPSNILFDKKDNIKLTGLSMAIVYFDFDLNKAKLLPKFNQPKLASHLPPECTERPLFDAWYADLWCVGVVIRQIFQRVKTQCPNSSLNYGHNGNMINTCTSNSISITKMNTRSTEKTVMKRTVMVDKHISKRSVDTNRTVVKVKNINQCKLWNETEDFIDHCVMLEPSMRMKPNEVNNHPLISEYIG